MAADPRQAGAEAQAQAAFPRAARLTRPSEFKRVFTRPMVSSDRYFKVLARSGTGGRSRLGMAVSRQVDRKATGRNRIKRLVRDSFRRYFQAGGPVLDIVVLPRSASTLAGSQGLFRSLEQHWSRLASRLADREDQP